MVVFKRFQDHKYFNCRYIKSSPEKDALKSIGKGISIPTRSRNHLVFLTMLLISIVKAWFELVNGRWEDVNYSFLYLLVSGTSAEVIARSSSNRSLTYHKSVFDLLSSTVSHSSLHQLDK